MCTRTSYVPGMEYSTGNQIHIHRHVIQLYDITYPVHFGIMPTMLLLFVITIFLSAALAILGNVLLNTIDVVERGPQPPILHT